MLIKRLPALLLAGLLLGLVGGAQAAEKLFPFVLASTGSGDVAATLSEVKAKLSGAGFELVGEYSPYDKAVILIVTSEALKNAAAKSTFGGYAAGQRVSVTKVGDEIQVAYTNPVYMANAYRMKVTLQDTADRLKAALGAIKQYGPEEGMEAEDIRNYHYMFGMEYFDEPSVLAEYKSFKEAVDRVEAGLAAKKGGVSKVYRIDVPGKDESVFGVHLTDGCSSDKFIMGHIDFKPIRSTPHLPYEMLVSGNKVYALYARFRIAINFPDLKMMGANSFFKIMCAPDAIEEALMQAAGVNKSTDEDEF
ncbi:MAG TPA: hypothetical protein ENI97_03610 [Gammaproteobacteria bacterium]|nr:hypothetical protein [Gammaproteobacteria bacterium]